ncbi:LOW QUALITY PROTEIN: cilia- and flagella-associated protein 100 [Phyllopteryx taeniolatus]|uniref:LOW QUALITY PROTEIN: cilia- and flagella-associated protein 100 n=1 Tax=Phyllopteryx taeniolatus TaxID=161469 RepID=UPI002AD4E717|nr:LOW QUALITY PROTEIN: cilia- and flagella-associated protein 100 [Phyllopteryx taeniolatus]
MERWTINATFSTELPDMSSKQNGVTKSVQADVKRRRIRGETPQSQPNSPDSQSILPQSEIRDFRRLPIHKKASYAAQMTAEQRKGLRARECKHDLISTERQKAVLEISLMTKRSEICKMDKAVVKEERRLKELEKTIEKDTQSFAVFLRENEKKSLEAQTFLERETESKQEKTADIKKLTYEISKIRSEVANYDDILQEYKRYRELLFKLSPPEWQEAQRAKLLRKVQVDKNTADEQNREPEDLTVKQDLENNMAHAQPRHSSAELASNPKEHEPDVDRSECEDNPELYFTDPKQLIALMTELTEQNLSLIKNSTRAEETLEELKHSMEAIRKRTKKDEELMTRQIDDLKKRIGEEKTRAWEMKKKVQLHVLLNARLQDDVMRALGEKVAEVYRCCVDDGLSSPSTLEKLASIEKQMSSLLHCLEDIPKESLEMVQKIKDSERRTRQREEKLKLQREKQIERMKKYLERSLSDTKKTSGRKLMPRCIPFAQKVKVKKVESAPTDDGFSDYFFTSLEID